MDEVRDGLLKEAVQLWGQNSQMGMAQEECAELIVAVNKYFRDDSAINVTKLASEIADVEIMMAQLREIIDGPGGCLVDTAKRAKLIRLQRRIDEFKNQ